MCPFSFFGELVKCLPEYWFAFVGCSLLRMCEESSRWHMQTRLPWCLAQSRQDGLVRRHCLHPCHHRRGARWCVPVQCVQWQTYLAKWAAQRAWWKLHVGIPRMLIFREQRYFMTSKLQVLLFILIFMALPTACTKIERRQAMVIVSVEMASHPHTHSQHKHVSKYSHGLRLSP